MQVDDAAEPRWKQQIGKSAAAAAAGSSGAPHGFTTAQLLELVQVRVWEKWHSRWLWMDRAAIRRLCSLQVFQFNTYGTQSPPFPRNPCRSRNAVQPRRAAGRAGRAPRRLPGRPLAAG
jgi:hypothetical protein